MKQLLYLVFLFLLATACANPGSGPDGGPYDEELPYVVSTTPASGDSGVKGRRVTLQFNEFIKLENASEKVTVSPPQIEMPDILTSGKRITVTLNDSLRPNTTYTIDFSDAIEDNNEGNPMGNYTFFFSTGRTVDTLEVGGHVLAAEDLEPIKGILVGLHSDTTDSAFRTRPFDRVARTDGSGRFSIKGVAPGRYRIYALNDGDGDFRFTQKSEMIAFGRESISPSFFQDTRYDTLWRDTVHYDTIVARPFTHFTPDDVVLRAFKEVNPVRHLLKTEYPVPEQFTIFFTAPSTHVPEVRGLNFDASKLLPRISSGNDTLTFWVADTLLVRQDTLTLALTYEESNDSTLELSLRTDTLELSPKLTWAKRDKQRQEEWEEWEKNREKALKNDRPFNEEPPTVWIKLTPRIERPLAPDQNPVLVIDEPLARFDTSGVHLRLIVDSTETEAPYLLEPLPGRDFSFRLMGEWRPGQQYVIVVDSAAMTSVFGHRNRRMEQKFNIAKDDEFGSFFVNVQGLDGDTTAIVELLDGRGKVVRRCRAPQGRADFFYLKPGDYYLRLLLDRNGDGRWTTGELGTGQPPEEVYYNPVKFNVRARWDIEQDWNFRTLPLTEQKPAELIKQKADPKKTVKNRNAERLRQLGRG
ncbi:lipoprotein [Prevotella sp. CAG:755]|nr:lipoprotein [Prevotella sp. CAG:755]